MDRYKTNIEYIRAPGSNPLFKVYEFDVSANWNHADIPTHCQGGITAAAHIRIIGAIANQLGIRFAIENSSNGLYIHKQRSNDYNKLGKITGSRPRQVPVTYSLHVHLPAATATYFKLKYQ